jgi:YYY domain-containing protein
MSDITAVLSWWILVQIFGLAALPLAFRLFQRLPDRGYGVSKALGLLLTSYLFWLLGILGFLRNDTGGMLFSLVTVVIASLLLYSRTPNRQSLIPNPQSPISNLQSRTTLSCWLRENWRLILIIEILFALTFGGWALYRAYVPRIMTAGGEKFMELAFLNSLQRSATLPPHDPWLSGFAISYYYFGYLMMSILIRLSGVTPAVGFNIGGALLFALTATGAFSLVYNLVARGERREARGERQGASARIRPPSPKGVLRPAIAIALLGMVFVVLLSNFEGPLEVTHWKGGGSTGFWRWLDIAELDQPPRSHADLQTETRLTRPGWWWWRASRVIFDYDLKDWPNRFDKTADPPPHRRENIDEFPFFSFLLGDMHPHVLALPFVMLALTASLTLFHAGIGNGKLGNWELGLFTLIFGALGFLNTWDFPIQWAVAVGAYTLGRLTTQPTGQFPNIPVYHRYHLRPILTLAATLAIGGLLLYAPFYIGFQSQAGGPLVHVHSSTRLAHFGVMFGPLLFILIAFLAWGVRRARQRRALAWRRGLWTATILLLLALGMLLATALVIHLSPSVRALVAPGLQNEPPSSIALRYLGMRLSAPWVTLLLAGMIGAAVAVLPATLRAGTNSSKGFSRVVQFSLVLTIAGAAATLIPEYVYLKDIFGVRINTIFKFYYQGWVLWAVAAAGAVYALLVAQDGLRSAARWLFGAGLALVVGLGLVYPLLAIPDRVKEFPEAPTLDGTVYFVWEQPADYAAVQWLNTHVEGAPVILETPGGAYEYKGRVSAQTGLPTLLGWAGHEWQWRGNTIEQDRRRPVIEELYSTSDAGRTLTLLDEYDITYVYVGPLERAKWPAPGLQKFDRLAAGVPPAALEIVYDRDGVTIYKRCKAAGVHLRLRTVQVSAGDVVLSSPRE